jgi:hypothetical protein
VLVVLAILVISSRDTTNYNAYPLPKSSQQTFIPRTPAGSTYGGSARVDTSSPAAAQTSTWHEVRQWSGTGMKQTESFVIASREWRVNWKTTNQHVAGILQIYVKTESGELVTLAANAMGEHSDTSYVRGSPGRYYLEINAANVNWAISVEDKR